MPLYKEIYRKRWLKVLHVKTLHSFFGDYFTKLIYCMIEKRLKYKRNLTCDDKFDCSLHLSNKFQIKFLNAGDQNWQSKDVTVKYKPCTTYFLIINFYKGLHALNFNETLTRNSRNWNKILLHRNVIKQMRTCFKIYISLPKFLYLFRVD